MRRREALVAAGAAALLRTAPARATPASMQAAIDEYTRGAVPRESGLRLEIAPLVENGHSVAIAVEADRPAGTVLSMRVFAEKNPLPQVIGVQFGPGAARARFEARVRLADSQTIVAVAALADGTFLIAREAVIVTIAACTEDG